MFRTRLLVGRYGALSAEPRRSVVKFDVITDNHPDFDGCLMDQDLLYPFYDHRGGSDLRLIRSVIPPPATFSLD